MSTPRSCGPESWWTSPQGLAPALIAPLEINRAKAELQSLLQTREVAIRDWRVASAQLAEILLLDPETLLEPVEPPFVQVTLIPATETAGELVAVAINNRPEIASQRELLAAANQRLKQEKKRPFLPNLFVLSPTTATGLLAAGNLAAGANGDDERQRPLGLVSRLPPSGSCRTPESATSAGFASVAPSKTWRRSKSRELCSGSGPRCRRRSPACRRHGLACRRPKRAAPGDRVGRQELRRSARDDPAGGRAAAPGCAAAGGRRRAHRARARLRAIRERGQRLQRRSIRAVSRTRSAGAVGHVPTRARAPGND